MNTNRITAKEQMDSDTATLEITYNHLEHKELSRNPLYVSITHITSYNSICLNVFEIPTNSIREKNNN